MGWLGAIFIGMVAAGLTLGIGQFLLMIVRPVWARLLIALVFVAPAVIAGYHATHGIVKHTMPSETWQFIFSAIGALAVGVTAFMRVAAPQLAFTLDRLAAQKVDDGALERVLIPYCVKARLSASLSFTSTDSAETAGVH